MIALPAFPLFLPIALVVAGALVTLVFEPFLKTESKHGLLPWLAAVWVVAAGIALACIPTGHFHGIYALDDVRLWLGEAILAATVCSLAGLQASLGRDRFPGGEGYPLVLIAAAGALLMTMAGDFLALFLALELTSLPIYALVGMRRHRPESNEALFKYFVMGAVFSAVLLYGIALTYGATGGTSYGRPILAGRDGTFWLGQVFILVGLLFKVGAVPFHFWVPDVYTGAPAAITGFMGAVVKVGGFAALGAWWLGLLAAVSGTPTDTVLDLGQTVVLTAAAKNHTALAALQIAVLVAAVLSLVFGNLGALRQTSARRILAYSAIAHAGYMLLAFAFPSGEGFQLGSLWIYLAAYAISAAGALTAIAVISGKDDRHDDLANLAGQGRARPLIGVVMTVFLASMAGIPVTVGFLGKFLVLSGLVVKGHVVLALVAVLMAVIGAGFYLRLLVVLWSVPHREPVTSGPNHFARWALAVAAAAVVVLVVLPGTLRDVAAATPVAVVDSK
jgi:NADH-quinone oxidoreductase subunit N